jgi:hypothetical protein
VSATRKESRPGGIDVAPTLVLLLAACWMTAACGKKGPPLPPLVKLPVAPAELTAERRGATVDVEFTVPNVNTDNTRPANVSRVDLYAFTAPSTLTPPADDQVMKLGTRIASVSVKTPRDPDQTIEEDEPNADMEPLEGRGLDQGARTHVTEELQGPALVPLDASKIKRKEPAVDLSGPAGPLIPSLPAPLSRTYLGVAVTARGRKGPLSRRASVPLVPPPPSPLPPSLTYDERAVTVKWRPLSLGPGVQGPASPGDLPATIVGLAPPAISYNVYDAGSSTRLNNTPITGTEFSDPRIVWGERRCYAVRTAATADTMTVESEASGATCTTLTDTFPPAPPANVQSSPGEGTITVIWDPNTEKDLAGYLVLRDAVPGNNLQPITSAPIQESSFRDTVQPGIAYVYAVKAVDKAGNVSEMSNRVQESAR